MQVDEGDGLDQDGHLSVARETAVSIRKYVHVPLEAKAQCVADFCGASPPPSMRGSFAQQLAALIGVTFDGTTASAETWVGRGRRERANEVNKLMASHRYKKLMARPASRVFVSVSPSGVHSAVDELIGVTIDGTTASADGDVGPARAVRTELMTARQH
jgi:hypothetical protein